MKKRRRALRSDDGATAAAAPLRLAEEEHVSLLTMHHIVSDGWSMGILVSEVYGTLYEAFVRGEGSPLRAACRCSTPTTRSGSGSG